jgi:PAS domain S-box-containing protein
MGELPRKGQTFFRRISLKWLGVLPFVLFLILWIVLGQSADNIPNLSLLNSILNFVFLIFSSLVITYLAALTFMRTGRLLILWLGAGFVLLVCVGVVTLLPANNASITMAVGGWFLASLVMASSILAGTRTVMNPGFGRNWRMIVAYGVCLFGFILAYILAFIGVIPPFFNPPTGFTTLKQVTSFITAGLFTVAAAYFLYLFFNSRNPFYYWLSLGIFLVVLTHVVFGLSPARGSIYSWLGRFTVFVGGIYWIMAVVTAFKEARTRHMPVTQTIADFFRQTRENYGRSSGTSQQGWISKLKWPSLWLLAGILITIIMLFFFGPAQSYDNSTVSGILNFIFVSFISLVIASIIAVSFVRSTQWYLIFLGAGQLLIGVSSSIGPLLLQKNNPNASVTEYNICVLVAGILMIVSVIFAWYSRPGKINRTARLTLVTMVYITLLILIAMLSWVALSGLTPPFVIQGGFSMIRQIILGLGTLFFFIAAVFYGILNRRSRSDFIYWYSLGLGMFSIGILGILIQPSLGSILGWTGRSAQFLSGAYFVIAAIVIVREARIKRMGIHELIAEFSKQSRVNFELLVNAASDAIIAVDGMGRVLTWNPAAEKIFGYSQNEIISLPFFNLLPGAEEAANYQKQSDAFNGDRDAITMELKGRRKDGRDFPVELTLASRHVAGGWLPTTTTTTTLIIRDITERKKAEESLKESEERFKALSETSPIGVGVSSEEGILLYVNPAYEQILGYNHGELSGIQASDLYLNPESRHSWLRTLQETGVVRDVETMLKNKDGTPVWVSINVSFINYNGQQAVMGTIQDINERKQAEDALKLSEERFFKAFRSSPTASNISRMDDGSIVDVNESFLRLFEYNRQDIIGHSSTEFMPLVNKAHGTKLNDMFLEKGQITNLETTMLTRSGKVLTVLLSVEKINLNGSDHSLNTIVDITERKQAEEQIIQNQKTFSELVERAPFGIYIVDADFRIAHMNIGSQKAAFKNVQPVIGRDFSEAMRILWPEPVAAENISHFRHTLDTGEPYYSPGFTNPRADVNIVESYEWELHRMTLPDGNYGVICYYFDSTRLREAEESVNKYARDLEKANQELEAFNYSVSHDLRKPIRSLESYVDLLLEDHADKLDETAQYYLERVRKASQLMSQLTDDLLKLSRISRAEMFKDNVNLSEIAVSITGELKASQPERQSAIKISPDIIASGDKNLLEIALRNLLENAWKFTSKNPQTLIEMGVTARDGERDYFIRDNGCGFDMQHKDRLFKPFERLHTEKEYPGTGIGLAIVQRIILRHGGRIWAESGKDKGTTFYFTLGEKRK